MDASGNKEWVAIHRKEDQARDAAVPEMRDLLKRYLASEIDTEHFRNVFDRKTRTDWAGFGFKGMSGAMFLNKLVKHISDSARLRETLRTVLPAPGELAEARSRLQMLLELFDCH